jgi:hypothetical protein
MLISESGLKVMKGFSMTNSAPSELKIRDLGSNLGEAQTCLPVGR